MFKTRNLGVGALVALMVGASSVAMVAAGASLIDEVRSPPLTETAMLEDVRSPDVTEWASLLDEVRSPDVTEWA